MLYPHRNLLCQTKTTGNGSLLINNCANAKVAQIERNTKKKKLNLQNAHITEENYLFN